MSTPELFTGTHNGEMVRAFLNASKTYFTITGISDENTKALLAKIRVSDTAYSWYDSQGYNETMVTFATLNSHILDYFFHFD